jgi:hypothetical protein
MSAITLGKNAVVVSFTSPKSLSITAAIAFVCLLVVVAGPWSRARPQEQSGLEIKNQTAALQLLSKSEERSGQQYIVKLDLMNTSNKGIVAYTLLKQDQTMLTTNGATIGWVLAPRETDIVRLAIPSADKILTVFAVLFDDGSGEGDSEIIRQLRDYRIGVRAQFLRASPMLRELQNGHQTPAQRARNKSELLNLPERHDDMNPSVSKSEGAKHAKQFILNQLGLSDGIDRLEDPRRIRVDETLEKLEKAMSKLAP